MEVVVVVVVVVGGLEEGMEEEVEGVGVKNDAVLGHGMEESGDVVEEYGGGAAQGADHEGVSRGRDRGGSVVVVTGRTTPVEEMELVGRLEGWVG